MNMCYTITALLYGAVILVPATSNLLEGLGGHGTARYFGNTIPGNATPAVASAEQGQPAPPPDTKRPAPAEEVTRPSNREQEGKAPQRREKDRPPQDFQPSEKIDADKAVDFPADI